MIRRPPRSTLFPYTTALPIYLPCSYGVRILKNRIAPEDAGVVTRLRRAGFILLGKTRSEEHTSELQSRQYLVCRLLLEKKKTYDQCTESPPSSYSLPSSSCRR